MFVAIFAFTGGFLMTFVRICVLVENDCNGIVIWSKKKERKKRKNISNYSNHLQIEFYNIQVIQFILSTAKKKEERNLLKWFYQLKIDLLAVFCRTGLKMK